MNRKSTTLVVLLTALLLLITGCSKKQAGVSGTFKGTGDGHVGPITVEITLDNNKITDAKVLDIEDSDWAQPAATTICEQVVSTGSIENLDAVSGATHTSNGTMAALKVALASANITVGVSKSKTEKKPVALENANCDIVIIGAGGAGLTAATAARNAGASVIVVEKMPMVGGNTNYATGGLNASETSIQKAQGVEDSNEQFFEDTMTGGHELNDPKLVHTLVNNSADTVDWLIAHGVALARVKRMGGSTNARTHQPADGSAIGAYFVKSMDKAAREAGADIRLNSDVVEIISDNGKATGVKVETKDGTYTINAKAVIITTGGFGANPDMIVKYKPELKGFGTTNAPSATGDGLTLVTPFNADYVDLEQIQTHPTVVPVKNIMITEAVRSQGAILVNKEGKRFVQELDTRDVVSSAELAQSTQTGFLIFDQDIREGLAAIESYAKEGLLTEADSLEDLANAMKIDSKTLVATVNRYNSFVDAGKEPDFGRFDLTEKIDKGPFYCVEVGPAVHHTMGGIKINPNTEVINKEGNIVPGLFAAGEVTGGVHGGNRLGGNAVADIAVFGRIAGTNAAAYIAE
jgi:fumarate reductase flavoprotein subunit